MDNIIQIPKNTNKKVTNGKEADVLIFKPKEKGIMIDISTKKEVFRLEDFLVDDDDVLFIG
jgi:hypothetical protein